MLFIATANEIEPVPRPLRDRVEVTTTFLIRQPPSLSGDHLPYMAGDRDERLHGGGEDRDSDAPPATEATTFARPR